MSNLQTISLITLTDRKWSNIQEACKQRHQTPQGQSVAKPGTAVEYSNGKCKHGIYMYTHNYLRRMYILVDVSNDAH